MILNLAANVLGSGSQLAETNDVDWFAVIMVFSVQNKLDRFAQNSHFFIQTNKADFGCEFQSSISFS